MKGLLRKILLYALSLFLLSQIIGGVVINGGLQTYIIGGVVFSLLLLILRPILAIITLPLNMATLGFFSFVTNAILLYVLTVIIPDISVTGFTFNGMTTGGFVIPAIRLTGIFAFLASSVVLSGIVNGINWLVGK